MRLDSLPLRTHSLIIRKFSLEDVEEVFALSQERGMRDWLPSQVYRDPEEARDVVGFLIGQYSEPADPRLGPWVLAIEHMADHRLIGHVGFSPIDDEVEIGFAIAQQYQGAGLAPEAIMAASSWVFATFGLERIIAITAESNTAARRTLARSRFEYLNDHTMEFQGTAQLVCTYALAAPPDPS